MISNRCARKSLVTNCNSIISKNYLRLLVDSNGLGYIIKVFLVLLRISVLTNFFLFDKYSLNIRIDYVTIFMTGFFNMEDD